MGIRISANDEALINNLISLNLPHLSEKEITIIKQSFEKIEKIAFLRDNLIGINNIGLEKEIAQLNNMEDKLKEKLRQMIVCAEMVYIHSSRDTFMLCFNGFTFLTSFLTMITLGIILTSMLSTLPIPLLTSTLIGFLFISNLIICQITTLPLIDLSDNNELSTSSSLKKSLSSLVVSLKTIEIKLEQVFSVLENKINYQDHDRQNPDYALPYEDKECPTPPSTPILTVSLVSQFFQSTSEAHSNNSAETQCKNFTSKLQF